MDEMQIYSHLERLERRHRDLDKHIAEGFSLYIDDRSLGKMKQERLMVKQEIVKIKESLDIKNET